MTSLSRVLPVVPVLLVALLAPRLARADEGTEGDAVPVEPAPAAMPPAPAVVPPTPTRKAEKADATRDRWYGWQVLVVDGVSLLVATPALPPLGVAGYVLGAPIVHAAHGSWGTAAGSVGLRVGLPLLGAFVGSEGLDRGSCRELCVGGVIGAGAGILTAIALDAAALSWETVPVTKQDRDEARARPARSFAVSPGIAPRREGGVDVGVTGVF